MKDLARAIEEMLQNESSFKELIEICDSLRIFTIHNENITVGLPNKISRP